ncbi:MAG TPA: hypothetical protein VFU22_34400 [Roseiflexaceae bacterium]|nr:hypothetical protein [Roseiflexaceae bacterium]
MASTEAQRSPTGFFRRDANTPRDSRPLFVQLPGLWKAMIITSFVINIILIAVLIGAGYFFWSWRSQIASTTVGVQGFAHDNVAELRDVVQQLQAAHIKTTIPLNQPLPLKGLGVVVPVSQEPTVTLVQDVPLNLSGADIDLGAGNRLRAQNISLVLPAGTPLTIKLDMQIPLDDVTIPIKLDVPVDIAMADTELAPQFRRLGNVVDRLVYPAKDLLGMPDVDKPEPPIVPK